MEGLVNVREFLNKKEGTQSEVNAKADIKAWGKPSVQVAPISLLDIEEEQIVESKKAGELKKSKQIYQPPSSSPTGGFIKYDRTYIAPTYSNTNAYRSESSQRESFREREKYPIPTISPFTIYVGNLPFSVNEDSLGDYFSDLGVKDVRIIRQDGRSKGFAYVEFHTQESLIKSLTANGQEFDGRIMTVEVQPGRTRDNLSSSDRDMDRGRWGPSSGFGPASSIGLSTTNTRRDDNRNGQSSERKSYGDRSKEFEKYDKDSWRSNKTESSPLQTRPKLELTPIKSVASPMKHSGDPFGITMDPEKSKNY